MTDLKLDVLVADEWKPLQVTVSAAVSDIWFLKTNTYSDIKGKVSHGAHVGLLDRQLTSSSFTADIRTGCESGFILQDPKAEH